MTAWGVQTRKCVPLVTGRARCEMRCRPPADRDSWQTLPVWHTVWSGPLNPYPRPFLFVYLNKAVVRVTVYRNLTWLRFWLFFESLMLPAYITLDFLINIIVMPCFDRSLPLSDHRLGNRVCANMHFCTHKINIIVTKVPTKTCFHIDWKRWHRKV